MSYNQFGKNKREEFQNKEELWFKGRTKVDVHCFTVMRKRRSSNKTGHNQSPQREQRQREASETEFKEIKYIILKVSCVSALMPTGWISYFA